MIQFSSFYRKYLIMQLCLVFLVLSCLYGQKYGRYQYEEKEKTDDVYYSIDEEEIVFAQEQVIDPDFYIVGPGDKLILNILTADNINMTLQVNPTGELLIPSVGVIPVAGKSLSTVIKEVEQFVIKEAYLNAKVNLSLLTLRNFKIQIKGAVNTPGFYIITPITRLHEIIEYAEGFHQFAQEFSIVVEHTDQSQSNIDFFNFWSDGNLNHNPTFLEGDVIKVPFGDIKNEGIVIRGSVDNRGYDIIKSGETLENYLRRRTKFMETANLDNIVITRKGAGGIEFIMVSPGQFSTTILQAGDIVDILSERGVMVNGFVQAPGGYKYYSGYVVADYISMAGGNSIEGDPEKVFTRHQDGSIEKGQLVVVKRGDVIIVPRTTINVIFGEMSLLQIITSVASILLTYIAATK